jgi:hypothetical protein
VKDSSTKIFTVIIPTDKRLSLKQQRTLQNTLEYSIKKNKDTKIEFEARLMSMLQEVNNHWDEKKLKRSFISESQNIKRTQSRGTFGKLKRPTLTGDMHNIYEAVESEGVECWDPNDETRKTAYIEANSESVEIIVGNSSSVGALVASSNSR